MVTCGNSMIIFGGSKTVTCASAILCREASKKWCPIYRSNAPAFPDGFACGVYEGNLLLFGKRDENTKPCYKRLHLQNVGRDGAVPDNTTVHTNSASGYLLSLVNNLILSDVEFVGMSRQL
ncbi:hypothetical protein PI125_g17254 [Phytophthora idaei]|nr:hypothetical protein PI125_g17254 [Phytophthora idaei]KAG3139804.1 hypothetical protein PI126_g16306 [Phytophthora idaei]